MTKRVAGTHVPRGVHPSPKVSASPVSTGLPERKSRSSAPFVPGSTAAGKPPGFPGLVEVLRTRCNQPVSPQRFASTAEMILRAFVPYFLQEMAALGEGAEHAAGWIAVATENPVGEYKDILWALQTAKASSPALYSQARAALRNALPTLLRCEENVRPSSLSLPLETRVALRNITKEGATAARLRLRLDALEQAVDRDDRPFAQELDDLLRHVWGNLPAVFEMRGSLSPNAFDLLLQRQLPPKTSTVDAKALGERWRILQERISA